MLVAVRIQIRRDTAANWVTANPVLADGEFGYEKDTGKAKIGDGVNDWGTLPYVFEGISTHSALTGLGADDHPQYLNEFRHDSLPSDNPHNVTKGQVGLGSVPNVDATDRANHIGTQVSSTVSDFQAAVEAIDATSSISLSSNILTYTKADGTTDTVDLSLYLDDTNLARIVSGVLNPTTGIITFTRDDSSTFTIDASALLDDQVASEVPLTPTGNLTSTDVQAGLEELQIDIDNINTAQGVQDTNISNNASAITVIQGEQTTQNTNISTNQTDISNLQGTQVTQDAAIALNTAKVSADGSITTHSDVDTSTVTPVLGDQLEWDGTNWVPKSIDNGFTIFPIWAEESGGLSNNNRQWSFGNGATGAINIPVAFDCEVFAMSFHAEVSGTSVSIELMRDDGAVTSQTFTGASGVANFTAIPFTSGQLLGFRTDVETGAYSDARICAWCRVKSTAAFPTPDRSVVNNSAVAFTAGTFTTIPGLSTTVNISGTGTVDGLLLYSAARSGGTNSEAEFRIVINGTNGLTFNDTLSTFNDVGNASFFIEGLPAGSYTVVAQAQVTQPILIASCQLTAVAVED